LFSILFNEVVAALYAGEYAGAPDNRGNPFVVPEKIIETVYKRDQ
jgi:hypothetical protein